jgi:phosphoribosylformimino-5-aminoimidazole carboxamide ribonucleotide (ProFAR) isomerase
MVRAIEGVYRNGKVELNETPQNISESRVFVLFVADKNASETDEQRRKQAVESLIAEMDKGVHLGGGPYLKREELYDRGSRHQGNR